MNAAAMKRGRARAAKERQREGHQIVRDYCRWSANGANPLTIPRCPTDAQWRSAREKGIVR